MPTLRLPTTARACLIALLLLVVAQAQAAGRPSTMRLDYVVVRDPGPVARFVVTLRFRGDASGTTTLRLPGTWASAQHAERGVDALVVSTPGARLVATDEPDVRRIVHRPGAPLTIRYRLTQIADGDPDVHWTTNYLPVIRPTYFEWIGTTAWAVPSDDDRPVRVHIRFDGLPDDWNFASSFGLDPHAITFTGSTEHFRESLYVGGDFRLRSRAVKGGRLITAVRGAWPFRDGELADRIATIVDGERAFWNDGRQGDFLVTMMPVGGGGPNARSFNGTGLQRSFGTWLAGARSLDELDGLFAHEYFHNWNPNALGRVPEPEALAYWFSEGFTDYYTHQLRLRWRMLTLEQYAAEYDAVLKSLAGLAERHLPNAEIGPRFFSEPRTVGKLPYWRGMLLAARWDAEIRRASNGTRSVDDLMRELRRRDAAHPSTLTAASIVAVARDLGVADPAADVARWVDAGDTIELGDDTLTTCVAVGRVVEPPFAAGFDEYATMKAKHLVGVDPAGPAFAAGLREGQALRSLDMVRQPDRVATAVVQEADTDRTRTVTFLPAGAPIERQHVFVRPGLADDARAHCLAELGVAATK